MLVKPRRGLRINKRQDSAEETTLVDIDQSRLDFMRRSGAALLSLSLSSLASGLAPSFVTEALAGTRVPVYAKWEDVYRKQWKWEQVSEVPLLLHERWSTTRHRSWSAGQHSQGA